MSDKPINPRLMIWLSGYHAPLLGTALAQMAEQCRKTMPPELHKEITDFIDDLQKQIVKQVPAAVGDPWNFVHYMLQSPPSKE